MVVSRWISVIGTLGILTACTADPSDEVEASRRSEHALRTPSGPVVTGATQAASANDCKSECYAQKDARDGRCREQVAADWEQCCEQNGGTWRFNPYTWSHYCDTLGMSTSQSSGFSACTDIAYEAGLQCYQTSADMNRQCLVGCERNETTTTSGTGAVTP